jgi:hypothetical protein
MTASLGLQDFLGALRSGDIEAANQMYTSMFSNIQAEDTTQTETPLYTEEEDASAGVGQTSSDNAITADISGDSPFGSPAAIAAPIEPITEAAMPANMKEMDAVAAMPDTDIMDDLKSVYDMINSARTEGTLQDKATKAAIQQRHKQLLEKLIDSALDEEE